VLRPTTQVSTQTVVQPPVTATTVSYPAPGFAPAGYVWR
jgi:hypothetical protein